MTTLERKRAYMISNSVDIQVEIEPVEFDDMANRTPAESSAEIRARVMAAREIQQLRFKDLPGVQCKVKIPERTSFGLQYQLHA